MHQTKSFLLQKLNASVEYRSEMLSNVVCVILCSVFGQVQNVAGIINGHDIDIEKRPYQVHIYDEMICGGAILNQKVVITAAHCVHETGFGRVRVGSNYAYQGELHFMAKRYIHPLYVTHGNNWTEFDVALAELNSTLTYSAKMQPIKLPLPNQSYDEGLTCVVSGWGLTRLNARSLQQLQTVTVKIVDREKCAGAFEDFAIVDDSMVCGESGRTDRLTGPCLVSIEN
jgi:secreted trypsin-like serine protease